MKPEPKVPVRSVRKALDLLEMIVLDDPVRRGVGLTVLARRMGMPPNSARNLLKTMIVCGFVAQTPAGAYIPGEKILAIGRLNVFDGDRLARIQRVLADFSDAVRESSVFAIVSQGRRIVLARAQSSQVIRVDPEKESQLFYALPTGRVLAAYASPAELQAIIKLNRWPGKAWNQIAGRAGLEAACAAIRAKGGCVIDPDPNQTVAMAVPALGARGELIGALGAYVPLFRCPPEKTQNILEKLKKTAQRITALD